MLQYIYLYLKSYTAALNSDTWCAVYCIWLGTFTDVVWVRFPFRKPTQSLKGQFSLLVQAWIKWEGCFRKGNQQKIFTKIKICWLDDMLWWPRTGSSLYFFLFFLDCCSIFVPKVLKKSSSFKYNCSKTGSWLQMY